MWYAASTGRGLIPDIRWGWGYRQRACVAITHTGRTVVTRRGIRNIPTGVDWATVKGWVWEPSLCPLRQVSRVRGKERWGIVAGNRLYIRGVVVGFVKT